jgi:NADH-quinone oxidoreductase subunit M
MFSGIPHPYNIRGSLVFSTIFNNIYSNSQQNILFGCLFSAPATKIPLFPFHTRLPEAHAEAPTIGSVILASLLSKLGGYGFLRSSIVICPNAVIFFHTVLYTTAVPGVIYGSLTTLRQTDLKRIIAYSPVAHMNAMTVGLFSSTQQGIDGAIFLMISHGIVSSAPFFCVGFVYDRYHTRLVKYYGGLVITMPIFTTFLLVFSLANMGFPLTSNFIGEILSFCGLFQLGPLITMLVATGIILSAMYSIRLFNRIAFGTPKLRYISSFRDLNRSETSILTILAVTTLIMGINAALILEYTTLKCNIAGDNKPP